MKGTLFTTTFVLSVLMAAAKNVPGSTNNNSLSLPFANALLSTQHAPLSLIENRGQIRDQDGNRRTDIQFRVAAAPGLNIFIGAGAIHYQFSKCDSRSNPAAQGQFHDSKKAIANEANMCTMYRMDVELVGANKKVKMIADKQQDYYENHFMENAHKNGIISRAYNKVTYKNIYPHIDWVLYIKNGQLEHEFIINEGGRATDIQLKYRGAKEMRLNADGSLTAITPQGSITERAPTSYQQDGKSVPSKFKLNGHKVTFETGSYTGSLVIDPVLVWGTYYGGSNEDWAYGIAKDGVGNLYITGETLSSSGIATSGAYQASIGDGYNAFLAKFDDAGVIQWATYYGGEGWAGGYGIAMDDSGNVYITGEAFWTSELATPGAYQTTFGGGTSDAFLAKFDSLGAIRWSTYFGGSGDDQGYGVATDNSGNVYITGFTSSTSDIATPGAYQVTEADSGRSSDAYLAKFNSSGAIQWATYYGGSSIEEGLGIATDSSGYVYFTGYSASASGIATTGAYQTGYGGDYDVFLAKFDETGAIQWGTYYGGAGQDEGYGIAIDRSSNVYITGYTGSTSGIATPGAYQTTEADGGGNADAFLAKFSSSGGIQWASYYGGTGWDGGQGICTDTMENVCITGYTQSPSGIATPGAYQDTFGGFSDVFITKFSSTGDMVSGTYYGGSSFDEGNGIVVDDLGDVYVAGATESETNIASPGAYQGTLGGSYDGFLAKFYICSPPALGPVTGGDSVDVDSAITLSDAAVGGVWSSQDTTVAVVNSGIVTGILPGVDTILYTLVNDCSASTAKMVIYVVGKTSRINNVFPANGQVLLYPNPAQNVLTISSPVAVASIAVSNLLGQTEAVPIFFNSNGMIQLDISGLQAGIYIVRINGTDVKKFLKE